jgi:hypothetical protein
MDLLTSIREKSNFQDKAYEGMGHENLEYDHRETACVNTSSGTRNVSLQNISKAADSNPYFNLRSTQNEKSITEYDIQEHQEQIATEQLCKLLETKAYEDVKTTPKDILTRGHPVACPARGGAFSYWYNNNKTNAELQAFLIGPLQNTGIAKKLKKQIVRYEIDAPYEIMRKSYRISCDSKAELPACLMLTKEDLFDQNNNYLPKNSKVEINNSDEIDIIFKWYFKPASFFKRCYRISEDGASCYESNRSLENGMYSESEVAKKLQKYLMRLKIT